MVKFIMLFLIGIVLIALGIVNFTGNISAIHWYHRRKVEENDVPKYGRCMGIGTALVGISLIASALLEIIFRSSVFDWIIVGGIVVGIAIMVYAQFKYNKGIF